jgi:ferrous iron transport protein A
MPNILHAPLTLDRLPTRVQAVIRHINTQTAHGKALQRRLMELGFVPGEKVEVLRRMLLGKGPLAVRVGGSTFALRPLESSLIEVVPA